MQTTTSKYGILPNHGAFQQKTLGASKDGVKANPIEETT
jgi:hypothetical protein